MPQQKSPGPANFMLKPLIGFDNHDVNSLKKRAPQWSLGRRLQGISTDKTPGANKYDIGKFTRFGKYPNVAASMTRGQKKLKPEFGPGPNKYNAVNVTIYKGKGGGAHTIGIKTKQIVDQCGPGPVAEVTPLHVYKNRAPTYPMFGRRKELSDGISPGPLNYDTTASKLSTMKTSPAYSMRVRKSVIDKDKKPGPADYDLTKHNPFASPPSYTLRRHHSEYTNVLALPNDNC